MSVSSLPFLHGALAAVLPKLAAWRRDFHAHPEAAWTQFRTAALIIRRLRELGYAIRMGEAACASDRRMGVPSSAVLAAARERALEHGADAELVAGMGDGYTGFWADLDCGPGPVTAFRFDMDCNEVAECAEESHRPVREGFASRWPGLMHACGHDMHATALLGAARLLKARESELVDANATIKLLFQPGEETFEGARAAIADGLLQNPRPQAAFAMHVNSQSPLGLVLYGSPALSGVYGFRITLQGKGGHGSSPEICIDPITAGVHVHLALQELISREVPAAKEVALTVGKFAGGLAANVIPDTCVLEGTLRGFDVELMEHLKTRIAEVVNGVAATYRTPATIETLSDVPPLVLDDGMTQASLGYVGAVLPKSAFLPLFHAMASEDFALISSEIPSAYFTVGAAVTDTDEHFAQHHPKARFSDAELPLGAAAYTAVALGYIADHKE